MRNYKATSRPSRILAEIRSARKRVEKKTREKSIIIVLLGAVGGDEAEEGFEKQAGINKHG